MKIDRRKLLTGSAALATYGALPQAAEAVSPPLFVGVVGQSGGAPRNSAEVQQFFDRLITLPSAARQIQYATLINSLVLGGVWAHLDVLDVLAAADSGTALLNLRHAPFKATLDTATGTPTFTVDRGFSAMGAPGNNSVNTNFNPSTAGGQFTQNDAMVAGWQLGTTQENRYLITDPGNSAKIEILPKWSDGKSYWGMNGNGTEIATTNAADGSGFFLMQRTASNACEIHRNDVLMATSTNASAALENAKIVTAPILNTAAAIVIGGSLTSGQQTTLYNALQTYLHAVGAV